MIVGIVFAAMLGAIALLQSWRLYRALDALLVMRFVHKQRQQKYLELGQAMERAHEAILRSDGPALADAIREANRVMAGRPGRAA